jgi:hypothetical protein
VRLPRHLKLSPIPVSAAVTPAGSAALCLWKRWTGSATPWPLHGDGRDQVGGRAGCPIPGVPRGPRLHLCPLQAATTRRAARPVHRPTRPDNQRALRSEGVAHKRGDTYGRWDSYRTTADLCRRTWTRRSSCQLVLPTTCSTSLHGSAFAVSTRSCQRFSSKPEGIFSSVAERRQTRQFSLDCRLKCQGFPACARCMPIVPARP